MYRRKPSLIAAGVTAAVLLASGMAAAADTSAGEKQAEAAVVSPLSDDTVKEIQRAIDEQRYVDAGNMLDRALVASGADPRLVLLTGRLGVARGRYNEALASFKSIDTDPKLRASAEEGEGIALSMLGRSKEAVAALQAAVAEDPSAWHAWNALGTEYDRMRDWAQAEAAYDHAFSDSDGSPLVLNNRGFSLLLQNRLDEATGDFVAALEKKPDLASARSNLRLAIAMKGEYDRAVAGAGTSDRAAAFNNAGFAAMLRGDYPEAENLLGQAMKAKGEYYARAAANLELTHSLEADSKAVSAGAKPAVLEGARASGLAAPRGN